MARYAAIARRALSLESPCKAIKFPNQATDSLAASDWPAPRTYRRTGPARAAPGAGTLTRSPPYVALLARRRRQPPSSLSRSPTWPSAPLTARGAPLIQRAFHGLPMGALGIPKVTKFIPMLGISRLNLRENHSFLG